MYSYYKYQTQVLMVIKPLSWNCRFCTIFFGQILPPKNSIIWTEKGISFYNPFLKNFPFSMFPLAFVAGWLQGHWWGFISRNYVVWPTFLLMNVFITLKGSHFWFLFDFTAAGVVPCGGRKTSPRTSIIVQFIFYAWSFEIGDNILRNQK